MKDSFILYTKYEEVFEQLSAEEVSILLKAIFKYVKTGTCDLTGSLRIIFTPIKQDIDANNEKYQEKCKKNKENIEKRWNGENTTVYDGIQTNTKRTDNDNDYDNDYEYDYDAVVEKENKKETATATDQVYVYYQNNIDLLTEHTFEVIEPYRRKMPDELIIRAMEIAIESKNRRLNYVEGILKGWDKKGIYTLLQAQEEQEQYRNKGKAKENTAETNRYRSNEETDYDQYYWDGDGIG